jgi:hypothetical protein
MKLSELEKPYREMIAVNSMLGLVGIPDANIVPGLCDDKVTLVVQITSSDGKRDMFLDVGKLANETTPEQVEEQLVLVSDLWNGSPDDERDELIINSSFAASSVNILGIMKKANVITAESLRMRCCYCEGHVDVDLVSLNSYHQDPKCEVFIRMEQNDRSCSIYADPTN